MCNLLLDEEVQFSDKVLFIIGNGFDISHGIKSRYADFHDYLVDNKKGSLLNFLDNFFNNSGKLWSDLENTLGEYDPDTILDECSPGDEIDLDHYMRSTAAIADSPLSILDPVLTELKTEFTKWVDSISIIGVDQKFKKLSSSSWYLTFNYLETLEEIYHVSKDKVFHIHGSRIGGKKYIFGHNNLQDSPYMGDEDISDYEEEGRTNIINIMNEYVKQYDENINCCPLFQIDWQTIRTIVVVGHSMSECDKPYFEKIQKSISPQVLWRISYHSCNDISSIKEKCIKLKISNYELFEI